MKGKKLLLILLILLAGIHMPARAEAANTDHNEISRSKIPTWEELGMHDFLAIGEESSLTVPPTASRVTHRTHTGRTTNRTNESAASPYSFSQNTNPTAVHFKTGYSRCTRRAADYYIYFLSKLRL